MERITHMMDVHLDFAHAIEDARSACIAGHWTQAEQQVRWFDDAVRLHIAQEERLLLPIHAELDVPSNGSALVVASDHRRIESALEATLPAVEARDAVAAQGALSALAAILEHHDEREHRWMVPALEAALTPEHTAEVLAEVAAEVEALGPRPTAPEIGTADLVARAVQLLEALRGASASGAGKRALILISNDAAVAQNAAMAHIEAECSPERQALVGSTHAKLKRLWERTAGAVIHDDRLATWDRGAAVLRLWRAHPVRQGE